MPHLLEVWNRIALPVIYRYPGLTRGAIVGYLLPALRDFVCGAPGSRTLCRDGEPGLLSPFFFRDWRRAHGRFGSRRTMSNESMGNES